MATKDELKDAIREVLSEQSSPKPVDADHKTEPTTVVCPECDHTFQVCKNCGGTIVPEDEEETEEPEEEE